MNMESIARKIKVARVLQDLSLYEVAERAGTCYKSVWRLEQGEMCTLSILSKVCEVLGLEITFKNKED